MKASIHPTSQTVTVTCECGNHFTMLSTLSDDKLSIDICSKCHPFYTGEQKIIDTEGKVEQFFKKYGIPKDSK